MTGEWRADPSGRHQHRYWDGATWTSAVADYGVQSVDPPTFDSIGPPPRAKRKKWPWVVGTILVLFGLLFVGCLAAVNNAVKDLNAEQRQHAITAEQFAAVPLGTVRADVIAQLGKEPEDTQEFVSKGVLSDQEVRSACIYYNRQGGEFGDIYQFCFGDADELRSKNSY